ncbi:MAG: acyltransferase [Alphaproteobacteria bacterium]
MSAPEPVRKKRFVAVIRNFIFRNLVLPSTWYWYTKVHGMTFGEGVRVSRGARLDKTNPRGVHIGDYSAVTSGACIVTHDFINRQWRDVHIGRNCFIGYNAVVLPGVTIGDGCIVSSNSVVARDVPAGCVVVGNPAKIVERDIKVGPWGIRLDKGNDTPVAH